MLLAREIGGQCRDRCRDSAGALQDAAGDHPVDVRCHGGDKLPMAKMTKPMMITRLRPNLSDAAPKAICSIACVRP